jgi:cell division protein FtsZ
MLDSSVAEGSTIQEERRRIIGMDTLFSIGELSSSLGISIRAIRYYEEIGLLIPCKTSETNYRYYSDREKEKLGIILILKKMGLSLREIKTVFHGIEPDSFTLLMNEHIERLQKEKEEILLKQEVLETVLSYFKGDPLKALREASMKKTDEINDLLQSKSSVKVIGVGSKIINVLNRLDGVDKNLEVIHITYEGEALLSSDFSKSIQLQGSSREIAFQEEIYKIRKTIEDTELLYILANVDNGITLAIAQEAQKLGTHTIGILTGSSTGIDANHHVHELNTHVDLLFDFSISTSSYHEDLIVDSVVCLSSLILKTHINIRDIQTLIKKKGRAYLGIGKASGLNKIADVMEQLFSNSFLHHNIIENTSCALLNITASDDLTMSDVDQILNVVRRKIGYDTNIIFGTIIDNEVNDTIKVSLILSGNDIEEKQSSDEFVETLIYRKHSGNLV